MKQIDWLMTRKILWFISKWLDGSISLEKLSEELGYNYYEFVERWPVFLEIERKISDWHDLELTR